MTRVPGPIPLSDHNVNPGSQASLFIFLRFPKAILPTLLIQKHAYYSKVFIGILEFLLDFDQEIY
jgi:hypothetical protein